MTEEQAQQKPSHSHKRLRLFDAVRNWGVTGLEKTGLNRIIRRIFGVEPEHRKYVGQKFPRFRPVKGINHLIGLLGRRTRHVVDVEKQWDLVEGIRGNIEDKYSRSYIFFNLDTSNYLWTILRDGVQIGKLETIKIHDEKSGADREFNLGLEYKYIKLFDRVYKCPLPQKTRIRFPISGYKREWAMELSPFGWDNFIAYSAIYTNLITEVCNDRRNDLLANERDPARRENIQNNINAVRTYYSGIVFSLLNAYCQENKDERVKFDLPFIGVELKFQGLVSSARQNFGAVETILSKLADSTLRKKDNRSTFIYFNTLKIIQPIVYGKGNQNTKIIDRLEDHGWRVRKGELGPGLDEFGYPLEVDVDNNVMLDKNNFPNNNSEWRTVPDPDKFTKNIDPLERINYEAVFFDTFRDDLRDGRYHPNSLSITDFLQANNPSLFGLWKWPNKAEHELHTDIDTATGDVIVRGQTIVDVPLNGFTSQIRHYKVRPTDKDPAFDLRALKSEHGRDLKLMRHIGRKYYYMFPDHSGELMLQNKDAHISSRGISMYLIEKMTREIEEFEEIKEALGFILRESASRGSGVGYDYGPRPWDMWGETMIKDIFNWDVKRLNTPPSPPLADRLDKFRQKIDAELPTSESIKD